MWIQIMNAAEWLLFILLIFNGIQIYRKLKHKEKIPRKTAAAQPPNRIIITVFPPFVNPRPPVSKGILCFPQL